MQVATGLLVVIFVLTSLAVGVRLIVLFSRTRRPPELLIGIGILGIGPCGLGGTLAGAALTRAGAEAAPVVTGSAVLSIIAGLTGSALFNWRTYRPDSRLARSVVLAAVGLAGAGFGVEWGTTGFADPLHFSAGIKMVTLTSSAILLWGGAESLRYWLLMRRRLALGLAEPLVTNRFLLYGLGIGVAGLGSTASALIQWITGLGSADLPILTFSNAVCGLLSSIAMWMAFLPPAAWRRYVAGAAS
jgi:hypothetical protein